MDPVLFELRFAETAIAIHAFGVAMALGLVVCWYVVTGPPGEPSRRTRGRAFVAMVGGAAAGALLGRLFGGGGLSLGVLGAFAFLRFVGPPATLGRYGAVALGLAVHAWGIGVWLDGAVFGYPLAADAPEWLRSLGIYSRWADGSGAPALFAQIHEGWRARGAAYSLATHPVGLYYAALGAALAAIGALRRGRPEMAFVLLGLFAIGRILLDGLRHDLSPVALAAERALGCLLLLVSVVGLWTWITGSDTAADPGTESDADSDSDTDSGRR